jgi:hypothetical protein
LLFINAFFNWWASDCCLLMPFLIGEPVSCLMQSDQFFSNIMVRTSYISMRWSCLLCTRPTPIDGFLTVLAHWNTIFPIDFCSTLDTLSRFRANQSLLSLLCAKCRGDAANSNLIVFALTQPGLKPTIYHSRQTHKPLHNRFRFLFNSTNTPIFFSQFVPWSNNLQFMPPNQDALF